MIYKKQTACPTLQSASAPSNLSYEYVPKVIRVLTLVFCFYLACPLFVIPLVKLSPSAPLSFILMLEISKRFSGLQAKKVPFFTFLLVVMLMMWGMSLTWNQIFGTQVLELSTGSVLMFRYAFWFIMGIMACRIFLATDLPGKAAEGFGWGCITMAVVILIEFVGFGGLLSSGWSALTRLSQNGYGWQFSAFFPFVLYLVMVSQGKKKAFAMLGLLLVLIAIVLNSSRSSWATTMLAICLFLLLVAFTKPSGYRIYKYLLAVITLALIAVVAFIWLPDNLKEKAFSRKVTVADIEQDKSWLTRQLMIQKGQRLFAENPLFGVGPGQFTRSFIDLDIPDRLSFAGDETYNKVSAHNSYIMLLAEGGLALVLPFGIMLLWLATAGLRAAVGLAKKGELWAISLYISLICFSIHFWSVSGITSTAPWFLYGFCAAMIMRHRYVTYFAPTLKV